MIEQEQNNTKIAALNDRFRRSFIGGQVMTTAGISELPVEIKAKIFGLVQSYDRFTPDNDTYGEHDFGEITINTNQKIFWKIDYYDKAMEFGSENPADPSVTTRVLTIMLASEY